MKTRLPISLIVDDGACINPPYWLHPEREHIHLIPNRFTNAFADWQSLFADGMEGGLAGLAETFARIERHLGDQVEWLRLGDVARLAR